MTNISIRIHAFMTSAVSSVVSKLHRDEGQDLIEYALLSGLIAAAIVGALLIWGPNLTAMATNIGKCIDFNNGTTCKPGF